MRGPTVWRHDGDSRPSLARINEIPISLRGPIGVYWGVLLGSKPATNAILDDIAAGADVVVEALAD